MKINLIIILTFINIYVFSQQIDYINNYHKQICKAELLSIENKFDSALIHYELAFNSVPYSFVYDYRNASYIAYKAGKLETTHRYIDSIIIRTGKLPIKYKMYYPNEHNWSNFQMMREGKFINLYKKRIDSKSCFLIDSLFTIDNGLRQIKWNTKEIIDSVIKIDSLIAISIINLSKKGILYEWKLTPKQRFKLSVMLCHKMVEKGDKLKELYKNGIISKDDYYYPSIRLALQFKVDTENLFYNKKMNNNVNLNIIRMSNGLVFYDKIKVLKKFSKKSKGLYYSPYVQ